MLLINPTESVEYVDKVKAVELMRSNKFIKYFRLK